MGAFAVCLVLWVTSVLPLMVTSILALVLLPTSRVLPAGKVYALIRQRGRVLHPGRLHSWPPA
jgi:hypothetical protein